MPPSKLLDREGVIDSLKVVRIAQSTSLCPQITQLRKRFTDGEPDSFDELGRSSQFILRGAVILSACRITPRLEADAGPLQSWIKQGSGDKLECLSGVEGVADFTRAVTREGSDRKGFFGMVTVEALLSAADSNLQRIFLATSSDEPWPYYQRLGFRLVASGLTLEKKQGHAFYDVRAFVLEITTDVVTGLVRERERLREEYLIPNGYSFELQS